MRGSQASRSSKLSDRMGKSFGIESRCLFQIAMSRYIRELSILSIANQELRCNLIDAEKHEIFFHG